MFNGIESKEEICRRLLPVLQCTCNMSNVKSLEYDADSDVVVATISAFGKPYEIPINVGGDSGAAMILDIVRTLM